MTTDSERDRMLGRAAYAPPPGLREGARHADADAYRSFVAASQSDAYWLALAQELPWPSAPSGARRDALWFPGGEFNLGAAVVERLAAEPIVAFDGIGSLRRVARDELARKVLALSSRLAEAGLEPGRKVCLALPSGIAFVTALIACWRQGLVAMPADLGRDAFALIRRVRETGCGLVLTHPAATLDAERRLVSELSFDATPVLAWSGDDEFPREASAPQVPSAAQPPAPQLPAQHPALLLANPAGQGFTTGAAGLAVTGLSAIRHLADGRGAGDTILLLNPPHHSSFASLVVGALLSGQTIALVDPAACTSWGTVSAAVAATGSRVAVADGGFCSRLDEGAAAAGEPRKPTGPALFIVEGESVEPRLIDGLRDRVFDGTTHVVQALSRPEMGGFVAGPGASSLPVRSGSVSLPAPGLGLVVVDAKGVRCPAGQGGLLALDRPAPSLAAELSSGDAPFVIGVRARADRDGYLWVMGEVKIERIQEQQVPLPELEAVLAAVRGVEQVAAVRFEDADGVTRTRAFVAPAPGDALLELLRAAVVAELGERAMPDSFQFVTRLPHSRSGKLLRSVLRRVSTGEVEGLDDISPVTEPDLVRELVEGRSVHGRPEGPDPEPGGAQGSGPVGG